PQGYLREGQRQLAEEVGALAQEDVVRLHVDHDVEVAGRSSQRAALTLAREAEPVAVFDARRDVHLEQSLLRLPPFAAARLARVAVHRALPTACRARTRDREEPLGDSNLSLPATRRARLGAGPGLLP